MARKDSEGIFTPKEDDKDKYMETLSEDGNKKNEGASTGR
jgi:hypothetical protein